MIFQPETHKPLPSAENEEKAILGGFLRYPLEVGALTASRGFLGSGMANPANAAILETLQMMWSAQKPIDAITLSQELGKLGMLEEIGGFAYIATLGDYMPSMALAEQYLATLEEKRDARLLIAACEHVGNRAYNEDPAPLVAELGATVTALATRGTKQKRTMKTLLKEKVARIESDEPVLKIVRTGIQKIDELSPLCFGDMPIISGETKSGKTMLALTIAANIATNEGRAVLYFSLEDAAEKPLDRILAGLSRIPVVAHKRSELSEDGFRRLSNAIETVGRCRIVIRDDVHDLGGIVATARQFVSKYPDSGAVIVDYAQLVSAPVKKSDTREREIATISRAFRMLAIELNVPVIVLSQLNSDGATRESKALENDMTAHWQVQLTDNPQVRRIVIPRQRNGDSGIVFPLTFLGHIARFENFSGEEDSAPELPLTKKRK